MKKIENLKPLINKELIIEQQYGQNFKSILKQINELDSPEVYLISCKRFGLKRILQKLKEQDVDYEVIGKKSPDFRLVKIYKTKTIEVESKESFAELKIKNILYKLKTTDSIFSREEIDEGTQILITFLERISTKKNKVFLDLGCGYGAISYFLAKTKQPEKILSYEIDPISVENAKFNLHNFESAKIINQDFLETGLEDIIDYWISNPPLHITSEQREKMVEILKINNPNLKFALVVKSRFVSRFLKTLEVHFDNVTNFKVENYSILTNFKI